jgi:hypothetical protein
VYRSEAIRLRETFLPPTGHFRHLTISALATAPVLRQQFPSLVFTGFGLGQWTDH